MKKTLKLLCGIICLLSVVLITLSGCDMGNLFDRSVNVPKGDGFTPVYYGMLMSTSPDVEIPPVSYEDVVKENAGNNGNHNGWYKKPDKDKENNGNTDNNGNHYGWYKDDNGDGKLDEDFQQQLCYLSQNQDVYFYVGIGNPAQLEIVSIQINGKTYTSDMFEANSTNEVKILKHNVGNAGGIVEYTIEEIKYSDGTEVKDVVLAGNKTARAGIKVENAVTAIVNNIELRDSGKEIFFDITIADDYSLIANSNGVITVTAYRDGKSVKSTELIVGKNEVTIETLNKNKEHEYEIVAYYDDLSGEGATYHTLISRRPVQEIHTHTFDVWTVTKEASCTEDGEKMRTCTACGEIETEKISATGHKWSNDCDTTCNVEGCGFTRETEHQFNNACDADCNVCGEIRVVLGHVYNNACDADCNVCGEIRVVIGHVYDNACDADCNVCGEIRVVIGHVYDNECDADCNICGEIRVVLGHVYDNACDADCNVCGEIRVVIGHVYDNGCDADCNICGEIRVVLGHVYDNACDADCNVCGEIRVALGHIYDNACDTDCNVCGYTRVTDHTYDDQYDAVCNVCGFVRDAECAHKNIITLPGKEANCIETGLTEGQKCGDCGETIVEQTILPATGIHTYENGVCVICKYKRFSEGLEYTSNGDGTCYVSGFGTCTDTDIIIPSVSPNGETVIGVGDRAFGYMAFPISSVVIPDSVTIIGREAFAWCEALTSVTIGNKVTHIGSFAFGCCSSLEKIDIPQSVTQIELDAFHSCVVLSCIEVDSDNETYCSIDGNLYTKDGKELVKYAAGKNDTTFIIPDGVETIGVYSVYCSTKITNIVMPDSVISIQAWAFQGCTSLTNVKLSNNIESIGYEAFGDCSSLMTIVIPNSIKTIGGNFFNWLSVLETAYYEGCESDWSKISIEENEYFFKATLYYYSATQPTTEGNFWHYVNGAPTVWEVHIHTYESKGTPSADYATVSVTYTCSCGDTYSETITSIVDFTVTAENRTMVGFTGAANENLVIPAVFENNGTWYRVISIGDSAFEYCFSLTGVTIPDSVITIGYSAFCVCTDLTSVTIGDSVTAIGVAAFYRCEGLTNVTIPNSVTTIGGQAFDKCTNLTSVTIGNSVTDIGCRAFESCTNLTSFAVDENNTAYQSINGNLYSKDGTVLVAYAIGKTDTSFAIPNSVTTIGFGAFACCDNLTSVTIPDSVITIDQYAFYKCSNVTGVMIPDSATTVESGAFAECSNITSVTIGNSVINIGYAAFSLCSNLADVYYTGSESEWNQMIIGYNNDCLTNATRYYYSETQPTTEGNYWHYVDDVPTVWEIHIHNYTSVVTTEPTATANGIVTYTCSCGDSYTEELVPQDFTVTSGNRTMIGYTGEENENLVIPAVFEDNGTWYRVTTIGDDAFIECSNLESVTISDSVTSIGYMAFYSCDNLASVTIPDSVITISSYAFFDCFKLASAIIPDSVTTIDDLAFAYCSNLENVTIGNSVTTIGDKAFHNCSNLTSVTIGDSVTTIGESAFRGCSNLTSVTIPDSVASIGDWAFVGCSNLTSVTIGDSVTIIGEWAFWSCTNLTNVTIGDSVITIGNTAFSQCHSLTNVTIGESVTTIGEQVFSNCDALTSIIIPDSVTSIGDNAFSGCNALKSVTIGNSVTSIGDNAFSGCDSLTSVYISDVAAWCHIVFGSGNSSPLVYTKNLYLIENGEAELIADLIVPDSVTSIGYMAFYNCSNITSVTIGDSVNTIGDEAFYNCSNITSVTIGDSVNTIGDWVFYLCWKLKSITFEGTVEQWNAIEKGEGWNNSITATEVICSDGVVSLV